MACKRSGVQIPSAPLQPKPQVTKVSSLWRDSLAGRADPSLAARADGLLDPIGQALDPGVVSERLGRVDDLLVAFLARLGTEHVADNKAEPERDSASHDSLPASVGPLAPTSSRSAGSAGDAARAAPSPVAPAAFSSGDGARRYG